MKTSLKNIVSKNLPLLRRITPYVGPQDDAKTVLKRIKDAGTITISEPDKVTEALQVTFTIKSAMAVTKGADLDEIVSLLTTATNGSVAAIGTSLAGDMSAANGIAGASVRALKRIMAKTSTSDNDTLQIPLTQIQRAKGTPAKLEMTALVNGWTRTNDWDSDEVAYFGHQARLGRARGKLVPQENVGKQMSIAFSNTRSEVTTKTKARSISADVDMEWKMSTDGAWTHDTVSLVQIDNVVVNIAYV
ncbi:hypothetical protein [Pontivivens insulae]|uniref:Uncharacterized protein n=1 Tax=Pontivivens insulae TaxID=1639689 RepID=A0A2R8AG21_9RHOB|nr:hypothetical protein [Pontivivens insulae]RED10596.1 hypothetical protein DFR53_3531 [Pontivivens insulae]SPF31194.1 hypothetical protein POI8812_03545 [Pontivivens insulae]